MSNAPVRVCVLVLAATLPLGLLLSPPVLAADDPAAAVEVPAAPAPAAKPPPYSLPWQLRPVPVGHVLRWDSSLAFYEDARPRLGVTFFSGLLGSYKIPGTEAPGFGGPGTGLAVVARLGMIHNEPPGFTGETKGGTAFVNPLVALSWTMKFDAPVRLNFFLGFTIPVGMGGGDPPTDAKELADWTRVKAARAAGIRTRSAMDNALFAVNDFTTVVGAGFAWTDYGVTVQAEVTVLHLMRVRGEKDQPESSKTNFTSGLHVGYFILPMLSVGADLRYQRWINPPINIEKQEDAGLRDRLGFDHTTLAIGFRGHFKLTDTVWMRPGISYTRALDWPMAGDANYHIVQFDLPIAF